MQWAAVRCCLGIAGLFLMVILGAEHVYRWNAILGMVALFGGALAICVTTINAMQYGQWEMLEQANARLGESGHGELRLEAFQGKLDNAKRD